MCLDMRRCVGTRVFPGGPTTHLQQQGLRLLGLAQLLAVPRLRLPELALRGLQLRRRRLPTRREW